MPVASIPQHFAVFIPRQRDQLGAPTPLVLLFSGGPLCGRPTLPPGNPVNPGYRLGCEGNPQPAEYRNLSPQLPPKVVLGDDDLSGQSPIFGGAEASPGIGCQAGLSLVIIYFS